MSRHVFHVFDFRLPFRHILSRCRCSITYYRLSAFIGFHDYFFSLRLVFALTPLFICYMPDAYFSCFVAFADTPCQRF